MDIKNAQDLIETSVPVARFLGIQVQSIEPGKACLMMPFAPCVLNHLGIVYAGAMFALAEIAGGVAMLSVFQETECTLLARRMEIDYVRPSRRDLHCCVRVPDALIVEARAALAEAGQADAILPIEVQDTRERVIARVVGHYYLRRK